MTPQGGLPGLDTLPLLDQMPQEARTHVAAVFERVSDAADVADGETLLHQGDLGGDTGYVLVQGRVGVARQDQAPAMIAAPALLGEIHQFNPRAQRTATVQAAGAVKALRFSWREFYAAAQEGLTPDEQGLLMDALERSVCERLDCEFLADLAALRGLPEPLKVRVSLALHWIAQRLLIPDGARLFEQDGLCGDTGYLLLHGIVELRKAGKLIEKVAAPSFVGIMIAFDPDLKWTAAATAKGDVELLKFSWLNYTAMLRQRLSAGDMQRFSDALAQSASTSFTH